MVFLTVYPGTKSYKSIFLQLFRIDLLRHFQFRIKNVGNRPRNFFSVHMVK